MNSWISGCFSQALNWETACDLGWRAKHAQKRKLYFRETEETEMQKHAGGREPKIPGKWEHGVHSWLLGSASRGLVLVQGLPPLSVSEVHEIP